MRKVLGMVAAGASVLVLLVGCGAARDIKDAAEGVKNAEKDTQELEARLERSKTITYSATYERKDKDGKTEEIVIAQKPPKSSYRQGDTQLIDDGQVVASCTKSSGRDECTEVGKHTDAGIFGVGAGFNFAFNPAAFVGLYTTAAIVPGVEAGKSTRDIAGQKSECVSIRATRGSDKGQGLEGCTTDDGIFTFSDDGEGNTVTLTKFEKSADDDLFTPPARVRTAQDRLDDATSSTSRSSTSRSSSTSSSSSSSSSSTSTTDPGTTTTT
jgi:hypothetical protein